MNPAHLTPSASAAPPLILVVDDAPDQVQTLIALLSGIECRVLAVGSGRGALEAISNEKPDLILLDVVMPEVDGLEVLRVLKQRLETRDLPVIFLTGRTDTDDIVAGLEAGAVDYLAKPINAAELMARVRTHLGLKRSLDSERALSAKLQTALADVNQLSGLIPICAHCKKIRNDGGFWQQVEEYISKRTEALFSHGICPECIPLVFPDFQQAVHAPTQAPTVTPTEAPAIVPFAPSTRETAAGKSLMQKILVVDDAPSNIHTLIHFLRLDYKMLVATSGPVALEIAGREQPDLILLDAVMPDMNGHEVCRRLKANPQTQEIPIIFVTGKHEEADEMEGFELGAVDYIMKPFSLPVVHQRIRTQLELKRYRDQLERHSLLDALTGIPNRRRFQDFLELMWGQAVRQQTPISVILMDVDHFKAFNDHYGHPAGDECLTRVARALASVISRNTDLIARYGGEEFVCVLPGTNQEGAVLVAETLRSAVEALALPHPHSSVGGHVTLSLGVASVTPRVGDANDGLVEAADQALYRAKEGGRNRVSG